MNSDYFTYSIVMLTSLFYNNPDTKFTVYLLYSDMAEEELNYLNCFINSHSGCFSAIKVNSRKFEGFPMHQRWTAETYYRLLTSELLPDSVQKVLYLDIDIIIDGKLDELFETDISNYYLAACKDVQEKIDYAVLNRKWNRRMDTIYFNAGVMLLNLAKIKKEISFDSYIEAGRKCQYELPYMDQDLLNYTMGSNAYIFKDCRYNYVTSLEKEMEKSTVYHYATPAKPWKQRMHGEYYDMWWKYAVKTEFFQ